MGVASKQVLRVGVVGAGSIGCLFAARLFAANRVIDNTCPRIAVSLVSGKSGARALFPRDELNQLRVTGLAGGRTHEIPVRRPKPLDDQQVIGK
jgi:ketopantoate reductase